jgi:hypothetical protein
MADGFYLRCHVCRTGVVQDGHLLQSSCSDQGKVWLMVLNATFNNISAILWRLVLLVEKIGVTRKKHCFFASHRQALSRNVVSSAHCHEQSWNTPYDHDNDGAIKVR